MNARDQELIRWPWHVKVVFADGTAREDDYADDFNPVGYARWTSKREDVKRVEITAKLDLRFENGEQVKTDETRDRDAS